MSTFNPKELLPDDDRRVIVHVPDLDRKIAGDDYGGIFFARYVHVLKEWRIMGSNSSWEIDWWCDVPRPIR